MFFVSCISHAFASVHCCLVVTCWKRADLLALVGDVYCIFVTFPCGILGQVWYFIVSFPHLCILSYFGSTFSTWYTLIIQMQRLGIILGVIPRRYFFCGSFFLFMFHVCLYYIVLFVPYSLVIPAGKGLTSWLSCA